MSSKLTIKIVVEMESNDDEEMESYSSTVDSLVEFLNVHTAHNVYVEIPDDSELRTS